MLFRLMVTVVCLCGTGLCAAEPPDAIQGNWLGTWGGKGMGGKNVAQIYGLGRGEYQAMFTAYDSGEQDKGEFTFAIRGATTADGKVVFDQKIDLGFLGMFTFNAEIENGKFTGKYSNGKEYEGSIVLKKIVESPDAVGAKPLPGAVVLFDGTNLDRWKVTGEAAGEWTVTKGALTAPHSERRLVVKTGHLACLDSFRNAQVHVEFRVPYLPEKRAAERGDSGVFLLGRYELQIVDSFGFPRLKDVQGNFIDTDALGAIFAQQAPTEQAALPPGEWQAFDITLKTDAKSSEPSSFPASEATVFLNGKMIHDRVALKKPTAGAPWKESGEIPGLVLQNGGDPVEFRNIWYVPLDVADKK